MSDFFIYYKCLFFTFSIYFLDAYFHSLSSRLSLVSAHYTVRPCAKQEMYGTFASHSSLHSQPAPYKP